MEKAALFWSGGKDAALALYKVQQAGIYQVKVLVTTMNTKYRRISMHGVREELVEKQAAHIGIPLLKMWLPDNASNSIYEEILFSTYDELIRQGITTIIFGDIFLEDLRRYREQLAEQKGLKVDFPLWKQNTLELLHEGWHLGFKTVTCCIDSASLSKQFLGKVIDREFIDSLPPHADPCGENGEFHSWCFDGPVFSEPIGYTTGEEKFTSLALGENASEQQAGIWFIDILSAAGE